MPTYFAYGSNLDPEQMRRRCPGARRITTATLHDHRLAFAGHSRIWDGAVATIEPAPTFAIVGGLYAIDDDDVAALDRCEGTPTAYQRMYVTVTTAGGQRCKALTYRKRDRSWGVPTPAYLERIRRGYRAWGLPLDKLISKTLVAVYGSLMSGLGNHILLRHAGAEMLGAGRTMADLEMISFGSFPAARAGHGGGPICCEVYRVGADCLAALDRLEGHPHFYRRQVLPVLLDSGVITRAWCYLIDNDNLWQRRSRGPVLGGDWRTAA